MLVETGKNPLPVKVFAIFKNDMIHVCAIKALAVLDIDLAPEQFFGRQNQDIGTGKSGLCRVLEPGIIDPGNVVG